MILQRSILTDWSFFLPICLFSCNKVTKKCEKLNVKFQDHVKVQVCIPMAKASGTAVIYFEKVLAKLFACTMKMRFATES